MLQTHDCFSGQLKTSADTLETLDWSITNPATGPVYIEGTKPGDLLRVDLLEVTATGPSVMVAVPDVGTMGDMITEMETTILEHTRRRGRLQGPRDGEAEADAGRHRRGSRRGRGPQQHARRARRQHGLQRSSRPARACTSPSASRARSSAAATCTRRWATARSSSAAPRRRATPASRPQVVDDRRAAHAVHRERRDRRGHRFGRDGRRGVQGPARSTGCSSSSRTWPACP